MANLIKKQTLVALGDRAGLSFVSWDRCKDVDRVVYTFQRRPGREYLFEVFNFYAEDLTLDNMALMVAKKVTRPEPVL